MALTIEKALEVNSGVLVYEQSGGNTVEGPFITGGPNSPVGLNLPEKTMYIQTLTTGTKVWRKFGNDINEWVVENNTLKKGIISHDVYIPVDELSFLTCSQYDGDLIIDGEGYLI